MTVTASSPLPADEALLAALREAFPALPADRVDLYLGMCTKYEINPDPDVSPREVLAVKAGGDPRFLEAPFCVIVTAGGLKLKEPMDEATEHHLRRIFHAFKKVRDPRTKEETVIDLPLPADLRLPPSLRDGIPRG